MTISILYLHNLKFCSMCTSHCKLETEELKEKVIYIPREDESFGCVLEN